MSDRETFDTQIMAHGHSLTINCTKALRRLGLDRGQMVRVTIERIPGDTEAPGEK